MCPMVLNLVYISPQRDVDLCVLQGVFLEDPPFVTILHHIREGHTAGTEAAQVSSRTGGPLLDEPEGQVEVRARQGTIEDLAFVNPRELHIPI